MSTAENNYRIGHGLPRCVALDADGFERLKATLGLNRNSCRKLIENAKKHISAFPKTKLSSRLSSSERDRLLLIELYEDKDRRYDLWTATFARVQSGDEKELARMPPSLEHRVLVQYLNEYDVSTPDSTRCAEVFAEWPDLAQHLNENVSWADFAASVWANIRGRMNRDSWDSLNPDQRTNIIMVAFAVATIVDDERLLRAVVKEVRDLAPEFGDLLDGTPVPAQNAEEGVLHRWTELCESLRALSDEAAGSPPVVDVLAEIRDVVDQLSAIEHQVKERCALILVDHLMSRVDGFLGELERDQAFSWFGEAHRTKLHIIWATLRDSLSLDQIRDELDRLNEMVPHAVDDIHDLAAKLAAAESRRVSFSVEDPADLASVHSWEVKLEELDNTVHALRREQHQARLCLLSQLSPFAATFEIEPPDSTSSPAQHLFADTPVCAPTASQAPIEPQPVLPTAQPTEDEATISQTSDAPVDQKREPPEAELQSDPIVSSPYDDSGHDQPPSDGPNFETPGETEPQPVDPRPLPPPDAPNSISEIAKKAHPLASRAVDRVTRALLDSPPRLAYAVQVNRLTDHLGVTPANPPPVLLQAALLADHLTQPDAAIASELSKVIGRFPTPESLAAADLPVRDLHIMLALAATLRPTLLSPQTGAWALLSELKPSEQLSRFYEFANKIAADTEKLQQVRVDSTVLKSVYSEAAWQAEYDQLAFDANEWRQRAPLMTMKYAPATNVWRQWFTPDGVIHNLLTSMNPVAGNAEIVTNAITQMENRKTFANLVRDTDRKAIGRRRGQDIHAGALSQLYEHAQRAVRFARRYLSLTTSRPSHSDFLTQGLAKLRNTVERYAPPALQELRALIHDQASLFEGAANTAAYAIDRFRQLLDNENGDEPKVTELYASGLFCFPDVPVNARGLPRSDSEETLVSLMSEPLSVAASLDRGLSTADFSAARRIVDWLEFSGTDVPTDFKNRFDEALRSEESKLRYQMDDTRTKVEAARSQRHLDHTERAKHVAVLVELERYIAHSAEVDFDKARATLHAIVKDIEKALDENRTTSRTLLEGLTIPFDSKEYQNIAKTIEQGDIITANELIERARRDDSPSSDAIVPASRHIFEEFFPVSHDNIESALEGTHSSKQVVDRISKANEFGGINLSEVPGAQRISAVQMLTAWFGLKHARRLSAGDKDTLSTLFSALGFIVHDVRVDLGDIRDVGEAMVKTAPLRARERCPVPVFGSFVNGNYRIVLLWGRPTEEDILQHADENTRRAATIVLYFGRLTKARRAALARLSRVRFQTLLVLDELLLVYLCGERDSRMPILFACSMPFTYVQPYVTTAGLVPPEMFYGREREMQDISDPNGSCFIYGGRQLGKTALLRAAERTFHQPQHGRFAVWIDLKGEGIGHDRTVDHIWLVIWRELRKLSVVPDSVKEPNPNVANRRRIDDFVQFLRTRFQNSSGQVLLLLLDEADRFLEMDARQIDFGTSTMRYRESSLLNGLMVNTDRSIKVVFAGLHNVLRTVRHSNHPLGHFGRPIQIGPLWDTAEALVRQPLLASGYRFPNDNLVTRILAQTNYYPNLIQLYGSELVKSMSRRIAGSPLYDIDEDVIDETYLRNTNLRDMIRSRFHLTLQLDLRYEVIAYSIAFECDQHDDVLSNGLHYREIDRISRDWWPQGFKDIEPYTDRFCSLLEEMQGLGVLRKVDGDRYTLRNPNVLLLMGTAHEIADNLDRNRELEQEFEPDVFRAHDPHMSDGPSRSPLTYQQEDALRSRNNGVSIACGLRAAGYDKVVAFLRARSANDSVIEIDDVTDQRQFDAELRRLHSRRGDGTTIYVITDRNPWSERWVDVALDSVRALRRGDKNVRLLFMTDPLHLWRLLPTLERFDATLIQWTPLRPWGNAFLRQWMQDVGFRMEKIREVEDHTGGWAVLLERLHSIAQDTGDLDTALVNLDNELSDVTRLPDMQSKFGLDSLDVQKKALRRLAELDEAADLAFLTELAVDDGIEEETLRRTLRWAEMLHLVRRVGHDTWQMDRVASRLLSSPSVEA